MEVPFKVPGWWGDCDSNLWGNHLSSLLCLLACSLAMLQLWFTSDSFLPISLIMKSNMFTLHSTGSFCGATLLCLLLCSLCSLYNWRYTKLGDLPHVHTWPEYCVENPGFFFDYQLIDVPDFNGVGESEPNPYFYQVHWINAIYTRQSNQTSSAFCATNRMVFRLQPTPTLQTLR